MGSASARGWHYTCLVLLGGGRAATTPSCSPDTLQLCLLPAALCHLGLKQFYIRNRSHLLLIQ